MASSCSAIIVFSTSLLISLAPNDPDGRHGTSRSVAATSAIMNAAPPGSSSARRLASAIGPIGPRKRHRSASTDPIGCRNRLRMPSKACATRRMRCSRNWLVSTFLCGSISAIGLGATFFSGRSRIRITTSCIGRAEVRISISSARERSPSSSGGGSADMSATLTIHFAVHSPRSVSVHRTSNELGGRFASHGMTTILCFPSRSQFSALMSKCPPSEHTSKIAGALLPISSSSLVP